MGRLQDQARHQDWDLVVGLTELPLHDDDGRHLLFETEPERRTAVMSLPALGGLRMHTRARRAVRSQVSDMTDPNATEEHRVALSPGRGRWRLLLGMVLANRPWLLVPGLKSALVAALATGAVATINSTVWLLAGSLSWWRLVVATIVSVALVVAWLFIDGGLWDRPDDDSPRGLADHAYPGGSDRRFLMTGASGRQPTCPRGSGVPSDLRTRWLDDHAVYRRSIPAWLSLKPPVCSGLQRLVMSASLCVPPSTHTRVPSCRPFPPLLSPSTKPRGP